MNARIWSLLRLAGGILMLRRAGADGAESRGFATALVCISTYMIITGIVFAPRRRALSWSALGAVVVFPIV